MMVIQALSPALDSAERARRLQRLRGADYVFHFVARASAWGVLLLLGAVITSLVIGAWPALQEFGASFFYEQRWNPVTEKYGALAPMYVTLMTSLIAMLIGVPVGLLIALFLTEL